MLFYVPFQNILGIFLFSNFQWHLIFYMTYKQIDFMILLNLTLIHLHLLYCYVWNKSSILYFLFIMLSNSFPFMLFVKFIS